MNDLPYLAQFDDKLGRIRGHDQHVRMGLDQDAGLALVGIAHVLTRGDGLGHELVEVSRLADPFAVAASAGTSTSSSANSMAAFPRNSRKLTVRG